MSAERERLLARLEELLGDDYEGLRPMLDECSVPRLRWWAQAFTNVTPLERLCSNQTGGKP